MNNTTSTIESNATQTEPMVCDVVTMPASEAEAQDQDALCNFYTNMTIEGLRKLGYQVKVNHFRYHTKDIKYMIQQGVTHQEHLLKPTHELRAEYDLALDQGALVNYNYMSSHGGMTEVEIMEPGITDPQMAYLTTATCSIKDSYNKKKGVLICLGRIFNDMCEDYGFTKQEIKDAVVHYRYMAPAAA